MSTLHTPLHISEATLAPFVLLDFQSDGVDELLAAIADNLRAMYTLPTGGGKTPLGVVTAERWLARTGARAVWLAHREELEDQAREALTRQRLNGSRALVTSPVRLYNSIRKGEETFTPQDLLIVDEAHHAVAATWTRTILEWPGRVIGLTATPWRLSKNIGFGHLYDTLIEGPSKLELIAAGQLVESVVKQPRGRTLISGQGNDGRGDYSIADTMRLGRVVLVERAVDWLIRWSRVMGRKLRTIVYALNISHAEALLHYARQRGIGAGLLTANTPAQERREIVRRFRSGELWVVINVAILTEGFDVSGADAVLMLRPTKSLALYLQMAGRPNRVAPGKEAGLIFDSTDNVQRLGHPDRDQEWSLAPRGTAGVSPPPTRCCHECQTVQDTSKRFCVSCETPFGVDCPRCGWVFGQLDGADFKMPSVDEETGQCEQCSIESQDKLFNDSVMGMRQFLQCFRETNGKLVFYDTDMTNTYWIDTKPDVRGRLRGGVYLGDPTARRHLPAGSVGISEKDRKHRLLFHHANGASPTTTVAGRNTYEVLEQLHRYGYQPIADSIASAIQDARHREDPRGGAPQ